ncbi:MAG: TonB-dependent receptor plug domain-containing protein, partial [Pseudomonadales bacterium]
MSSSPKLPVMSRSAVFRLSGKGCLARAVSLAPLTVFGTLSPVVYAQPGAIEEIVVKVQRRSETLADVPIAVTAVTGEFVRDVNLDDVKDLVSFTPGLTGNSKDSFIDALNIRGIV